ncbi:MAG: hypothetical protein O2954_16145 [bacterium]|nr:hypothetical protein [bacterium]
MVKNLIVLCGLLISLTTVSDIRAQNPPSPADFNGDNTVDFSDFILFAQGYGKTSQDPSFDPRLDLNFNNVIDFTDFVLFAQQYGASNPPDNNTPPHVYILDLLADRIDVLDTETNLIDPERTVRVSQPRGLAFSTTNKRIYVAGVDSFSVLREDHTREYTLPLLDPGSDGLGPTPRGGFRVALSPDSRFAYVTEEIGQLVEVIDLQSRQSVQRIRLSAEPVGIAVSANGMELYVGAKGRRLTIIDAVAQVVKADSVAIGGIGNGRIALAPDGSRIYSARISEITGTTSAQLISINPASRTVVDTLELAQAGDLSAQVIDLALSRDGNQIYATLLRVAPATSSSSAFTAELIGSLVTVNTATFQKVNEIRIGDQVGALGLSPDGKTAYVSGVRSFLENPSFQILIVDLETRQIVGSLFGFDLPVFIRGRAAKVVPYQLPEIAIF